MGPMKTNQRNAPCAMKDFQQHLKEENTLMKLMKGINLKYVTIVA